MEIDRREIAKKILACAEVEELPFKGNRNCGIFVSIGDHRFSDKFKRVSCKFYKGNGATKGFSEGYNPYHKRDFPMLSVLNTNPHLQQSLESDVFEGEFPYSVFQFIEGKMLRDVVGNKDFPISSPTLSENEAISILNDMFCKIWIPIWSSGLRFRDGHTGNWVLGNDGKAYMIDTEQMRKDAAEFRFTPDVWQQRNRHEKSCLKLIKGIFADIANASGQKMSDSQSEKLIAQTDFIKSLTQLGRSSEESVNQKAAEFAKLEFDKCLAKFFKK